MAIQYTECPEDQEEHGEQGPCIIINGMHCPRTVLCDRCLAGKALCRGGDCKRFRKSLEA